MYASTPSGPGRDNDGPEQGFFPNRIRLEQDLDRGLFVPVPPEEELERGLAAAELRFTG